MDKVKNKNLMHFILISEVKIWNFLLHALKEFIEKIKIEISF
jgi:hypothetical protein